jgi:hypothetical protein
LGLLSSGDYTPGIAIDGFELDAVTFQPLDDELVGENLVGFDADHLAGDAHGYAFYWPPADGRSLRSPL